MSETSHFNPTALRTASPVGLTLLHSERPKLYGVLAVLSAMGLRYGIPKVFPVNHRDRFIFFSDTSEKKKISQNYPSFM